jgi:hypothetical protein
VKATNRPPVLSIVFSGRDDEYWSGFQHTITLSISYALRLVLQLGLGEKVEIVVVDWGSKTTFLNKLNESLDNDQLGCLRGFHIPHNLTDNLDESYKYHGPKSANFGIKRSRGEYVWWTGADHVFTKIGLFNLVNFLENLGSFGSKTPFFGMVPRRQLNFPAAHSVTHELLDEFFSVINYSLYPYLDSKPNSGGGMGGFLLDRKFWNFLEGYAEHSGYYGWTDAQLFFRAQITTVPVDLSEIGFCIFKLPRSSLGRKSRLTEMQAVRKQFPNYLRPELHVKNPNWGVKDAAITDFFFQRLDARRKYHCHMEDTFVADIDTPSIKSECKEFYRYFKLQAMSRNKIFTVKVLREFFKALSGRKFSTIVMDYSDAKLFLAPLAIRFKGIQFVVIHTNADELAKIDSEESIGYLTKKLKNYHYGRIRYLRGRDPFFEFSALDSISICRVQTKQRIRNFRTTFLFRRIQKGERCDMDTVTGTLAEHTRTIDYKPSCSCEILSFLYYGTMTAFNSLRATLNFSRK